MPKGYTYGKLGSSGPGPYRPHAGWRNNRPPGLEATVRRGAHVGWHRNEGSCLQAEGRGPCEDRIRQLSTSGVNKRNLTSSRLTIRIDHRSYYECPRASRSSHLAPHSTWSEAHRSVSRLRAPQWHPGRPHPRVEAWPRHQPRGAASCARQQAASEPATGNGEGPLAAAWIGSQRPGEDGDAAASGRVPGGGVGAVGK
jgi:hypothetical protein